MPTLSDILDPEETAGVDLEQNEELRPYKRALIVTNALRAADQLLAAKPDADYSEIRRQLKRLLSADPDNQVKVQATHLLERLSA